MGKVSKATADTITFTPAEAKAWLIPPFQRPLRINPKVQALAVEIHSNGGILPGVLSFGILDRKKYLIDGQHRREAFLLSGAAEGLVDIRVHNFDSMAEMGEEFVKLNSRLVVMRPDDILRGIEGSIFAISKVRKECPFVGYDMIRRSDRAPILSMSAVIRCWHASGHEVPASVTSALSIAQEMKEEDTADLVLFLKEAHSAWGRDPEYQRLWSALNLTICMWLYRRIVITKTHNTLLSHSSRTEPITLEHFRQCLMSLSASADYCAWLLGRKLGDRDRSPCLLRIKNLFGSRLKALNGKPWKLPAPSWASDGQRRSGYAS